MSLRSVWIISPPRDDAASGKLLFTRTYPTVEKRARVCENGNFVPFPQNAELLCKTCSALSLRKTKQGFVKSRDSCALVNEKPVYQIETSQGVLWPVLIIQQNGAYFCCLPLVEQGSSSRPPLLHISGLALGFTLLLGLAEFVGPGVAQMEETNSRLGDLYVFLGQAAPFGTPIDVNPASVRSALAVRPTTGTSKLPAWKPIPFKGKQQLTFTISESIRAVQYGKPGFPDSWDVSGYVKCHAELEGQMVDVTISLSWSDEKNAIPLDHILVHPFVTTADVQVNTPDSDSRGGSTWDANLIPRKMRFFAPPESFILCHYSSQSLPELPIKGIYEMRGEKVVDLTIQLTLSERVKNSFEYCQLQMPFHHRGTIQNHDATASQGTVEISQDKKILLWNIGQKFPTKSLVVNLKAKVTFSYYDPHKTPGKMSAPEQFYIGQNAYAELLFKIVDFTHTNIQVDTKSVQISPHSSYKLSTSREYASSGYKLWNIHGDAQMAFNPPNSLLA